MDWLSIALVVALAGGALQWMAARAWAGRKR
jgi:hypothetical protein